MVDLFQEEIQDLKFSVNKELVKDYPFLMPLNVHNGETLPDFHYECTWLDWMPDGWRIALGLDFCKELKEAAGDHLGEVKIYDIKEKYGELDICLGPLDSDIFESVYAVIDKYRELSTRYCIHCGKPATHITKGWIVPICDKCDVKK